MIIDTLLPGVVTSNYNVQRAEKNGRRVSFNHSLWTWQKRKKIYETILVNNCPFVSRTLRVQLVIVIYAASISNGAGNENSTVHCSFLSRRGGIFFRGCDWYESHFLACPRACAPLLICIMHDTRLPRRVFTCRDRSTSRSQYRDFQHKIVSSVGSAFSKVRRARMKLSSARGGAGERSVWKRKRRKEREGKKVGKWRVVWSNDDEMASAVKFLEKKVPALINSPARVFERARLIKQSA